MTFLILDTFIPNDVLEAVVFLCKDLFHNDNGIEVISPKRFNFILGKHLKKRVKRVTL